MSKIKNAETVDSWECVCGNTPSLEAFQPCNVDGIPCAAGDETEIWRCRKCDRLYADDGTYLGDAEIGAPILPRG